jgi:MYXO-CTERM domain-containing protein
MSVASISSLAGCLFRAAPAFVAVGVFLAPLDATAMSCESPGVTAPFRQRADVPTNTRIWCTQERQWPSESIVLTDAQGSVVSGTQAELSLPDVTVLVFRPDVELEPQSTYTYKCPLRDFSEFTFTTGAGPRIGAPPVPDSSRWAAHASQRDGMPDSYFVSFDSAAQPDSIIVYDIGGAASMDTGGPSGVLSDVTEALYRVDLYVGNSICQNNWPDATLGASTTVALGAFDVTGAFSGWSDSVTVTIPSTPDDPSPEITTAATGGTSSTDSPPDSALADGSAESEARPLTGCGLSPVPDGSPMAIGALAAVTGLAAARRRRHHRPRR